MEKRLRDRPVGEPDYYTPPRLVRRAAKQKESEEEEEEDEGGRAALSTRRRAHEEETAAELTSEMLLYAGRGATDIIEDLSMAISNLKHVASFKWLETDVLGGLLRDIEAREFSIHTDLIGLIDVGLALQNANVEEDTDRICTASSAGIKLASVAALAAAQLTILAMKFEDDVSKRRAWSPEVGTAVARAVKEFGGVKQLAMDVASVLRAINASSCS
jgi:hypothetical protein